MTFATSFKVEFLSDALSPDGSFQWVSNAYRYRTVTEATQHTDYLRGDGAPPLETSRIVATDDPINTSFENGKSARVGEG